MKASPETIQLIIIEYLSNKNIAKTAKKFGFNKKTIKSYLVKNQIELRDCEKDCLGEKFGRLKILGFKEKDNSSKRIYECRCECGTLKRVRLSDLKSGKIKSCGCLHKEISSKTGKRTIRSICHQNKASGDLSGCFYSQIRHNAIARNINFFVSKDYLWELFLIQQKKCALSGVEISMSINKNAEKTASLDRIDNNKGYEEGNVHWVHKDLNKMKLNHSLDKFLNWCRIVSNFNKIQ